MSVGNGQDANATNFNAAFVSKSANSTVTGQITLNNGSSGGAIANLQQTVNTLVSDLDAAEVDIGILQGQIEALAGPGDIGNTSFTIVNGQAVAAAVTGLLFDSASVKMALITYRIYRNTTAGGATNLVAGGTLMALWNASTSAWVLHPGVGFGDDPLVTFSISTTGTSGQVKYVSDSITGTADASVMVFNARTMG